MTQLKWLLAITVIYFIPSPHLLMQDTHASENTGSSMENQKQYFCTYGSSTRTVNILYSAQNNGLPCAVTYQQQNHPVRRLLKADRNVTTCETKAENMAFRLIDRGWNCKTNTI